MGSTGAGRAPAGAPLSAGAITVPTGVSLFSRAVRWARRLTSSLRRASASWLLKARLAALPTWEAAVAARRSSTTLRVWVSMLSMRADVTVSKRWARLAR